MNRFIEKPDCYLAQETGLEWQKEQNKNKLNWKDAVNYCKSLGEGWRLPTQEELFSLVDNGKQYPCTDLPKILSAFYWSSTTHVHSTDYAWPVYFYYGDARHGLHKSLAYYARAVRSGKGGE